MTINFLTFLSRLSSESRRRIQVLRICICAVLRQGPLLFKARPGTPLRVLCIAAFDAYHEIRFGELLPVPIINRLVDFLIVASSRNAMLDHKPYSADRYLASRQSLAKKGWLSQIVQYESRLDELEKNRPTWIGNLDWEAVTCYREKVVYLSIEAICDIGRLDLKPNIDKDPIRNDSFLDCLFRLVILFQLTDDLLDGDKDERAKLPTFVTACWVGNATAAHLKQLIQSYSTHGIVKSADTWILRAILLAVGELLELAVFLLQFRLDSRRLISRQL